MVKNAKESRVCSVVLNCEKAWIVADMLQFLETTQHFFRNMKRVETCFSKKKPVFLKIIKLCLCVLDAGLGIFAKERFECDVVFGPYWGQKIGVADVTPSMDQSYMWDVRKNVLISTTTLR